MDSIKLSRRMFLKTLAASAGGLALAACGATPTATPVPKPAAAPTTAPTAAPAKGTGHVVVTQYMNANMFLEADAFVEGQAWTVHLPKFNQANKDILLKAEGISSTEFATKLAAMTQAKELGNALLWISGMPFSNFVNQKLLLPLDDVLKQAGVDPTTIYTDQALALNRYDPATNTLGKGQLWALPQAINAGIGMLCYNATMLQAAGADIPKDTWTYDDILVNAKKVVAAKPGTFGYMHIRGAGGTNTHGTSGDYAYIAPFGGYIFDAAGKKALINSPDSVAAWQWIYDLEFTSKVAPTVDDMKAMGDYKQAHMASKLAMYKEGPWGAMHYKLIPAKGKEGYIEAGEVPSPLGKSGRRGNTISTDSWGISANATDPQACLKALLWMTNTDAAVFRAKGSYMAGAQKDFYTRQDMLSDPFITNTIKLAQTAELPYMAANGRTSEVDDLLKQSLSLLDGGSQKPTQAFFDDLNNKIQTVLDKPAA